MRDDRNSVPVPVSVLMPVPVPVPVPMRAIKLFIRPMETIACGIARYGLRPLLFALMLFAHNTGLQAADITARVAPCTVCHGDQGRAGHDAYYPRIAGKPAGYLLNQLHNFRDGRRHFAWMTALLDPLPEPYLAEIAEHFASLTPPYAAPTAPKLTPGELEQGRRLVLNGDPSRSLPACTQCHQANLLGLQPAIPGLLGLTRGYVVAQIGAWQAGSRRATTPDCMARIAQKLRPQELAAIAEWLAAQPVPLRAKPENDRTAKLPLRCGGVPQGDAFVDDQPISPNRQRPAAAK